MSCEPEPKPRPFTPNEISGLAVLWMAGVALVVSALAFVLAAPAVTYPLVVLLSWRSADRLKANLHVRNQQLRQWPI